MTVETIPSEDVRALVAELGWELSDRDRAALLHALELPCDVERAELLALANKTGDTEVRAQIGDYVARQNELLALFGRKGGDAVYEVSERGCEPEVVGYFSDLEAAVERGRRLGRAYKVTKHRVAGAAGSGTGRVVGMTNPHLMPADAAFEDLVATEDPDDGAWPLAWAAYGPDGEMELFGSSEAPPESRADVEREYDPARFENALVELPSPFEAGDIVRTVGPRGCEGDVGVVETGRDEWAESMQRLKRVGYANFHDGALVVSFLEGGTFSHRHVSPAFLERFDPPEDDPTRELLLSASGLVAGHGLDWFLLALEAYRKQSNDKDSGT